MLLSWVEGPGSLGDALLAEADVAKCFTYGAEE
jgi:hypothetical protein